MFKFLYNKPFWVHLFLAIIILALLIFLFITSLNWITRHGESSTVPSITGKKIDEAKAIVDKKGFDLVIQDSVYYDSIPPGMVLKQVPDADEVVKINRTVYATINRFIPPDVELPKLNGLTYKNAELVLNNTGLRIGDTTYKTDFAKNTILEVLYEGKPIAPGTKIKMGNKVDLVISSGLGSEYLLVPNLLGLTYAEAKIALDSSGIIMGAVVSNPDVTDQPNAFIYKQRPSPRTVDGKRLSMRTGQMIDLFLQKERPNVDSLNNSPHQTPNPQQQEEPQ